ncbi:MAG: GntR family transcriptional regulator [Clostridia bacterium]|nr:GntR family transcriptional regulator [Clostridia bacterium]
MIPLNLKSGVPIWEQIKEQFKKQILMGVWAPGEQLPSVRSLASELGINPNTIQRAYSELEREGLSYTVQGRGCFVEEDLTAIQIKKTTQALERLEVVITELKESGIQYDTIIKKISKLYEEGRKDD